MLKGLIFKNYYYSGLILNVVSAIFIIISKNFLPPLVPLFYGEAVGIGQLVPTFGLLIAPGISIIIIIINIILSLVIKDNFLKKILAVSAFTISVLMIITIVKIILLVGFF